MNTVQPPKNPLIINRVVLPPDFDCLAITRCTNAWNRAHQAGIDAGKGEASAIIRGNQAYRNAIPPLTSPDNIRDFISCVTHGVLFRAILEDTGTRLLYAAQVAAGACKIKAPQKPKTSQSKRRSRSAIAKNATLPPPPEAL